VKKLQPGGRLIVHKIHVKTKSNIRVSNIDRVRNTLDLKRLQEDKTTFHGYTYLIDTKEKNKLYHLRAI